MTPIDSEEHWDEPQAVWYPSDAPIPVDRNSVLGDVLATRQEPSPASPSTWDMVRADIAERDRVGLERYGVPLSRAVNIDGIREAYDEALDLVVYLRHALDALQAKDDVIESLSERVARQSELLSQRAERGS